MSLHQEIEQASAQINTDAYAMSLGEIINLYRDGELVIRPAFQRLFRWSVYQKSRFIESILLGIPVPSIFVSQREDGVWEVVDGLQRLSTVLEFVGELKDADGRSVQPSTLVATRYLPDLDGRTFETGDRPLDTAQRIAFKRSKLDVKIVKEADESKTKYDLFDRLNSGGAILSDQEFRNSLVVMTDPSFMDWLESLRKLPSFQSAVSPSERQTKEQYDLELVVRYLTLLNRDEAALNRFKDLRESSQKRLSSLPKTPPSIEKGRVRCSSASSPVSMKSPTLRSSSGTTPRRTDSSATSRSAPTRQSRSASPRTSRSGREQSQGSFGSRSAPFGRIQRFSGIPEVASLPPRASRGPSS